MSLLHADVAVVGSEICGLAAGALLAHGHLRVVVLLDEETDTTPLGKRLVPRAPTLWRLPASGPAAKLIEELGLKQEARRVLGEPVGLGLIDDPEIRCVIEVEEGARGKELRRVFDEDDAGRIDRGLGALALDERDVLLTEATRIHDTGFFARRREKRRLESSGAAVDPTSHDSAVADVLKTPLGAALPYLLPYVQSSERAPVDELGGYLALSALSRGTVVEAEDGLGLRATLQRLFFRVIQGHGGDVVEAGRVSEIQGGGKKLQTVVTDGKNNYQVRAVVDATEARTLTARLPSGRARDKTESLEADMEPVSGAAVVRWLLPRLSLPRGLPPRALILPREPGADHGGLLAIYDELPEADGARARDDDDLVAAVIAHWSRHESSDATVAGLEARLEQVLPFARDKVVARDTLVGDKAWAALPTYRAKGADTNPLGGRRPQTGFANLVRAGRDLVPLLGLQGELAASRAVAAAVFAAVGQKRTSD